MGGGDRMDAMNKQLADTEAQNKRLEDQKDLQDKRVQTQNIDDLRRRRGGGGFSSGTNNTLG